MTGLGGYYTYVACLHAPSSRHQVFLRICRSGLFRCRITRLPSPLAKVSLEEFIFLLARGPHSSQNMPAHFCRRVITRPSLPFFLSHENRKLLAACVSWLPGTSQCNQMVQRQRRYALFALGMLNVTVGSFVVALLDVRDNFMHLLLKSATQISSSSSSGLRLRK